MTVRFLVMFPFPFLLLIVMSPLFFIILQFIQVLINVFVFSKNQLLILLGLYNVCLFSILIILGFIFVIYFLIFSLGVICRNFSKVFKAMLNSLIFIYSPFLTQGYTYFSNHSFHCTPAF